jgi:pimeloyl-ACP methyl ester carboxylesterase
MARIVLVHGAYNELWGPHEIASRWVPAVRDGLWHHGVEVADSDIAVCFYGDLFRRSPEAADAEAFATARAGVAEALNNLDSTGMLDAISQAASGALFDRTVDMVTTMTTVPDLADQIYARLAALVDDDTRVVVGHSLGSVVAYRAFLRSPQWTVDTLVTLGSPLAAGFVRSTFGDAVDGVAPWPGQTRRWVNVAAISDKVARPADLSAVYGDRVENHLVDNGARAHDPEPYLNAAATGAAIARALG